MAPCPKCGRSGRRKRTFTHDQQTLGLQVEAMTAYIKDRGWDAVRQVKDVRLGERSE